MKNLISLGVDYIDSLPLSVLSIKGFRYNKEQNNKWRRDNHYWSNNNSPHDIANRILKNNIGKSFDLAFSYYCKKVDKQHQKKFLEYFKEYQCKPTNYERYSISDNRLIVFTPYNWKTPKEPIFRSDNYKTGYNCCL